METPQIDYQKLVQALVTEKTTGSTPTATYGHGPGGAFSSFGISKPVFGALILPNLGLGSMLPAYPSMDTNPLSAIMTGITAPTGSNQTGPCTDCKTAGLMKLCLSQVPFGRYCLDTQVYQVDRIGERRNRGEFTDLALLNRAFENAGGLQVPSGNGGGGNSLNREFDKAMFEFAVSWMRLYAPQLFTASPANNSAAGGYKEFAGLDIQINSGHVDAETGVACTAADPIIQSMANAEISTNGATYVSWMTNIWRRLNFIADRTGLSPARWVIVMRQSAFWLLTDVWPCAYNTYRCTTSNSGAEIVDGQAMIRERDAMRRGKYLTIDGENVPVIIDDGITETMNAGESFNSSIYFVPISVLGGTPVTYWEYFDFSNAVSGDDLKQFAPDGHYSVSDNGRFLWVREQNKWCVNMSALNKPRVVLATPYIAARLTNVRYTPLAHERDSNTSASYYKDGGGTSRDSYGPSYYLPVP